MERDLTNSRPKPEASVCLPMCCMQRMIPSTFAPFSNLEIMKKFHTTLPLKH